MHLSQRILLAAAVAMAIAVSAGAAMAHGYNAATDRILPGTAGFSGAWPVTITHSQFSNGTGCLTLKTYGTTGSASLVFGNEKYPYGSVIVIDGILVANITEPLYGQNGALMFIAHASLNSGHIGHGAFENIEGGSNFDYGDLAFGTKGGC